MGTRDAVIPVRRAGIPRAPRPLEEGLAEIAVKLEAASRVAVLLDFDGTLAPIAPTPDEARLEPETRDTLLSLAGRPKVVVAIVSGRSWEDLRQRVGIPDLIYAGCHGLVIRGRGLDFVDRRAQLERPAVKSLAERLSARLSGVAGVLVEDKQLGISVHFRRVAAPDRKEVALAVQTLAAPLAARFRVRRGREVWEIVPKVNWDKGRAVHWILERTADGAAVPIFMGDDVTDEDAFAALSGGITIKVGHASGSSAAWSVTGPAEARAFLSWLGSRPW